MNVVVVTPTHNDAENIERLLPRPLAHGANHHIIEEGAVKERLRQLGNL